MATKASVVALSWVAFGCVALGLALTAIGNMMNRNRIDDVIFIQFWISTFFGFIMLLSMPGTGMISLGLLVLGAGLVILLVGA
ncbi:MAG: hypothetical protein HWN67_03640, partial [Candidatus Helarchaeota archaeon]|nr:hypothetical protein [Candidatus Helarchaeota archaeon]